MKYIYSILFSLCLHVLLWTSLAHFSNHDGQVRNVPVEVSYVEAPGAKKSKKKQIVAQTRTKNLEKALDNLRDKVHFLSQRQQRVKAESVARKSGKTQNRNQITAVPLKNLFPKSKWSPSKKNRDEGRKSKLFANGIAVSPQSQNKEWRPKKASAKAHIELRESTLSEHLPHVKRGGFTSLNTNQFLFYTFYSRINDRIRYKWVDNIQQYIGPITQQELKHLAKESRVTHVEIILNKKGEFEKAIILKSSNIAELDQAAINTFKETTPYVNPPQELLDSDGKIHLKYGFYVVWKQPRFRSRK